jgi:hypothetical protein
MFKLLESESGESTGLSNLATGETFPLEPQEDPTETFRVLGSLINDEVCILMPSPDGDSYRLEGFVLCFPAGFDTGKKLGMKLREIHAPVPSFKEKLKLSMERYFERLPVGKYVLRANVGF